MAAEGNTEAQGTSAKKAALRGPLAKFVWAVLVLALIAAAYSLTVFDRLDQAREHDLRSLHQTAQAVEQLLTNAKRTLKSLNARPDYACEFFKQQRRLTLVKPLDCKDLGRINLSTTKVHINPETPMPRLEGSYESDQAEYQPPAKFTISIRLDQVLKDAPFGDRFDAILVADHDGRVIAQHRPTRISLFQPPGKPTDQTLLALRVEHLHGLQPIAVSKKVDASNPSPGHVTSISKVELAGATYMLMCQPLRLDLDQKNTVQNWRLCGLAGTERSLRQALEIASPLVVSMLAMALLAVLAWPIFKVITVAPRERLRFIDFYFLLLATSGILMVATIAVLSKDASGELSRVSAERLEQLAKQVEINLIAELLDINAQLNDYEKRLAQSQPEYRTIHNYVKNNLNKHLVLKTANLLQPLPKTQQTHYATEVIKALHYPTIYPYLTSVYWMRPCDGRQFIKATVRSENTPAVKLETRGYFQAVKQNRLWNINDSPLYVQTAVSFTTGNFFAALSAPSGLDFWNVDQLADISSKCRGELSTNVVAAITARPLSMTHPVLAPGVGFAIVDASGKAVFHSHEGRATLENLLDDEGISARLRAALVSQANVHFSANYRAKSHQLYVTPLQQSSRTNMPWSIVTFVDNEVIRTVSFEILARATILIALYLFILTAATIVYLLLCSRDTPRWLWPLANIPRLERTQIYYDVARLLAVVILIAVLTLRNLTGDAILLLCMTVPILVLILVIAGFAMFTRKSIDVAFIRQATWVLVCLTTATTVSWYFFARSEHHDWFAAAVVCVLICVFALRPWPTHSWASLEPIVPRLWKCWNCPLRPYMLSSVLLWLIIAVLPAYGFFNIAQQSELSLLAELEQSFFQRAHNHRALSLEDQYRNVELPDKHRKDFLAGATRRFGVYDASLSTGQQQRAASDTKPGQNSFSSKLWEIVSRYQPLYNDTSLYARLRESQRKLDAAVTSDQNPAATNSLALSQPVDRNPPYSLPITTPTLGSATFFGSLAILVFLWVWTGYVARRLFFGELGSINVDGMRLHNVVGHGVERHTLAIIGSPFQYRWLLDEDAEHDIVDLSNATLPATAETDSNQPIMCVHLEQALRNHEQQARALQFLESLLASKQPNILLVSSGDPAPLVVALVSSGSESEHPLPQQLYAVEENQARWQRLLIHFEIRYVSAIGSLSVGIERKRTLSQPPDAEWIEQETNALYGLHEIIHAYPTASFAQSISRREALETIVSVADPYFQSLWDHCSSDEKLGLVQLEQEGVVNPKQIAAVRSLLRRGLVRMDPVLRPVNHSFGLYISRASDRDELIRWEKELPRWANLRNVLIGVVVVILLFLWFTQREVVEIWIAYMGAVAVGISGVLKMMGSLRDGLDGGR